MTLSSKLSKKSKAVSAVRVPVWLGPESSEDQGGITFSLLSRFVVDPERFRIHAIEGLKVRDSFNHKMEYGNFGHACEEAFARDITGSWVSAAKSYRDKLSTKYPNSREEIEKWYRTICTQFPIYVDHWKKHPDIQNRTPLLSEQVFHVPYTLPSGRVVWLKGKWDSVDLVGKGKSARIWLMENKYKGKVDVQQMQRQLTYDAQTMIYLVVLTSSSQTLSLHYGEGKLPPIAGVRYNICRRPLTTGTKGSIVRHKATKNKSEETWDCFFERLRVIIADDPKDYFYRWNVEVKPHEIENFRQTFLDPTLERLCWWYDLRTGRPQQVGWDHLWAIDPRKTALRHIQSTYGRQRL